MTPPLLKLGLIVNPQAGVGGPAGLKGSDDKSLVASAIASGADGTRARVRIKRCLNAIMDQCRVTPANLAQRSLAPAIVTCGGAMGESAVVDAGFAAEVVYRASSETETSAIDTQLAAQEMLAQRVDLLLFVGGDGTARDICQVVGEQLPVLGVPSGVKMHSGVFAISPEGAAEVVLSMLSGDLVDVRAQEVRDIDEQAFREGVVKSRFYGEMKVPECGHFVQSTKNGGREVEELVLDDIAADLRERLEDDVLYLVGAGTTPQALMSELDLANSLLGVDVIQNEQVILADASAVELEALLSEKDSKVVIILSVTGGQGSLIGRGNQQLSPAVLRRAGRENVWVVASKTKIRQLGGRPLLMDSHDLELDRSWSGYIEVLTGYHDCILYPLGTHFEEQA